MCEMSSFGIIHLVRAQKFPKNYNILPPGTNPCVCTSGGKSVIFLEHFVCALNKWPL